MHIPASTSWVFTRLDPWPTPTPPSSPSPSARLQSLRLLPFYLSRVAGRSFGIFAVDRSVADLDAATKGFSVKVTSKPMTTKWIDVPISRYLAGIVNGAPLPFFTDVFDLSRARWPMRLARESQTQTTCLPTDIEVNQEDSPQGATGRGTSLSVADHNHWGLIIFAALFSVFLGMACRCSSNTPCLAGYATAVYFRAR